MICSYCNKEISLDEAIYDKSSDEYYCSKECFVEDVFDIMDDYSFYTEGILRED